MFTRGHMPLAKWPGKKRRKIKRKKENRKEEQHKTSRTYFFLFLLFFLQLLPNRRNDQCCPARVVVLQNVRVDFLNEVDRETDGSVLLAGHRARSLVSCSFNVLCRTGTVPGL